MRTQSIDASNAEFWDELCGSGLAQHLGITDHSLASLKRFDDSYLEMYPYLLRHVPVHTMRQKRVLEIGLGYGTLGQKIVEAGAEYVGLDIAEGPVKMMNHRMRLQGLAGSAQQGSMLECPLPDESVDCVVSIGCFHHTGDTQRCIDESYRVLRPGGWAYVMVYNLLSYRQWERWPRATLRAWLGLRREDVSEAQRRAYDKNTTGAGAPETAFFHAGQLRRMFGRFAAVTVQKENCDPLMRRDRVLVPREALLRNLGRLAGLDLYAAARK